ncbi:MAG TPA: ABC transporter permease subunit [Spirochaetota bacterium]|nr:ABC transporter permease subunit [Spirochaetota bacterium]HOS32494.1 ABC transporter permease subunit [Spirochaetota bacterium]HOS56012.1 ABC transporter permease subunit [Spirochaetota bacterium]HPK61061.1 ABC transporter permease subunit [Spirochaetota bacterium]HQF76737.1 ABC transporter permease subunit [Spirochaetota bacterium]
MLKYILKRLLLMIPTLIGISIVCFFITRILPGGPIEQAIAQMTTKGDAGLTKRINEKEIERLKKIYGFDKPAYIQYFVWMKNILRGDFGESFRTHKPVLTEIGEKIPISLIFGLTGFFLSYIVCIPLGVKKALSHNTAFDTASSIAVYAGYSIPGFALGVLLLVLLGGGSFLNLFPLTGVVSNNFENLSFLGKIFDVVHHMVLPVFCYTIGGFAVLTSLMKNSLMDELNKDYVRAALAKGVPYKKVIFRHALRNALIPIATGIGGLFGAFFAGSILIEKVFTIPGMGLLGFESVVQRNYPVVLGLIIIQSLFNLLGRILSDFALVVVDPRITFD